MHECEKQRFIREYKKEILPISTDQAAIEAGDRMTLLKSPQSLTTLLHEYIPRAALPLPENSVKRIADILLES